MARLKEKYLNEIAPKLKEEFKYTNITQVPRIQKVVINMGVKEVMQLDDGWTIVTQDGKPSAHFEHDIVVRKGKVEVLSTFKYIEQVLNELKVN